MALSKLRRILTCGRAKESKSNDPKDKPHVNTLKNEDDFDCLSEVAAPFPIERVTTDEQARRESLESNISETHSHPHLSNN